MTYGPVIPGQTQGTTPPFFPQQDDRAKQILDFIMKSASQRRFAGQPRPAAVPGLSDPAQAQQIGLNTSNPHGWGAERFMGGLQAMMRNAVAMSKERQINKAMADWDYAQSSLNEYYSIDQQDQNAVQQWHHKYDWFWQDEKKLKNMAKSLNQDWLNPEKTTVHGEALKRKAAQVQETSQKKNAAATGIKNMFKSLLGRQQQVQLSPGERGAQEQEIIGRAPTTTSGADPKSLEMSLKFMELQEKVLHDRAEEARQLHQEDAEIAYRKAELELQKDRLSQDDRLRQQQMKIELDKVDEEKRHHKTEENLKRQELFLGGGTGGTGSVDEGTQALVKKIANYEIDPKTLSIRGGHRERIMSLVAQYDPTYDQTQYGGIQSMRKDFASGTSAKNVRSLNTAIGHLETLKKSGDELRNGSFQLWNSIANKGLTATGDPRVTKFNTAANAVESEMANVFKGTGATDQEIKAWREQLSSAQSPAQIHGAIDTLIGLMSSRMGALNDQRNKAKMKPDEYRILDDESRKILRSLGGESATRMLGSESSGGPESNTVTPPPGAKVRDYTQIGP